MREWRLGEGIVKLPKRGSGAESTLCDVPGRHRESARPGERGPEESTPAADAETEEVVPLRAEAGAPGVARRLRVNGGMALLIGGVAVPAVLGGVVVVAMHGGGGDGTAHADGATTTGLSDVRGVRGAAAGGDVHDEGAEPAQDPDGDADVSVLVSAGVVAQPLAATLVPDAWR